MKMWKNVSKKVMLALLTASFMVAPVAQAALTTPLLKGKGNGMVVSSQKLADEIGQKVLDKGGNAMDAAVAVGYALAVCHPNAGNIGGGGFAIVHTAKGEDAALDFREMAPGKATRDMYLDAKGNVIPGASTKGYKCAGVPGSVAGFSALLEKYGTMKLKDLIAPSIEMASKGFIVSKNFERTQAEQGKDFFLPTGAKYFLHKDGSLYKEGELFVQKDLAKTLSLIAKKGPDGFYKGETADLIAKDMAKNGGLITKEDLAKYKAIWRKPSETNYRGYKIVSMCPPSSGGIIIAEILNVMENANIGKLGFQTPATINVMAEAMRQAYADRSEYLGDPDFVKIPAAELTDKNYAANIYKRINPDKAIPSTEVKPGLKGLHEGNQTTHYSVVDKAGNAVSITYTINDWYGAGAAVDGAGFLLNNEMDDFSIKAGVANMYGLVGSDANAIAPYKRPLSSMSPSIVSKDGKIYMVVGSPGGSRIITTVLQVMSNVIDHKMPLNQAVAAPRLHMQWQPDEIRIERVNDMSAATKEQLAAMGYKLVEKSNMGDVNAIIIDPKTGEISGSHDPRS